MRSQSNDTSVKVRIREMILSGEMKPGERVTEAALAERLGLSRTPIRGALPVLAAEAYLEEVGKRGYAVKEFSEHQSLQALHLRASLEGFAARTLAERGASPGLMDKLASCLAEGDLLFDQRTLDHEGEQKYGAMNARFHSLIIEGSQTPLLESFCSRLNLLPFVAPDTIVFEHAEGRRPFDRLFRAHGDHHAIVDAIRSGEGARVESIFREHAFKQVAARGWDTAIANRRRSPGSAADILDH